MSKTRSSHRRPDWANSEPKARSWPRGRLRTLIRLAVALALCAPLLLAGCSFGEEEQAQEAYGADDPAIIAALNGRLMTDPDLVSQNEASSALVAAAGGSLPPENVTTKAADAARSDAGEMVGGAGKLVSPPTASEIGGQFPPSAQLTVAARAALTPGGADCASKLRYSAIWAARLPKAFPVYPRGSTQEAAGTNADGCVMRVVHFVTPVTVDDVLAFYNTRAQSAGYSGDHQRKGGENILSGSKGDARYTVFVRELGEGMTGVDLVTRGG